MFLLELIMEEEAVAYAVIAVYAVKFLEKLF
jgi:hypothetical protein